MGKEVDLGFTTATAATAVVPLVVGNRKMVRRVRLPGGGRSGLELFASHKRLGASGSSEIRSLTRSLLGDALGDTLGFKTTYANLEVGALELLVTTSTAWEFALPLEGVGGRRIGTS